MKQKVISYLKQERERIDKMIAWLESQDENNQIAQFDETSYQVGVKRVLENPESYGLEKRK